MRSNLVGGSDVLMILSGRTDDGTDDGCDDSWPCRPARRPLLMVVLQ
jgi:hypothetical protein